MNVTVYLLAFVGGLNVIGLTLFSVAALIRLLRNHLRTERQMHALRRDVAEMERTSWL